MTFQDAQQRLLAYVRDRIHNGELTERGFARRMGISQPHVHNVLKVVRNLSLEISDSVLKTLHISLLDLIPFEDLEREWERRKSLEPVVELPFLDAPIGPGMPWPANIAWRDRFPAPFPRGAVPPGLVVARLNRDPRMPASLGSDDLGILDTSEWQRVDPSPEGLYAVEHQGEAVLRYVRPGARFYYLVTDTTLERPEEWEQINVSRAELSRFVKGRVLWIGREKTRDIPLHQRGRFLYEVISS